MSRTKITHSPTSRRTIIAFLAVVLAANLGYAGWRISTHAATEVTVSGYVHLNGHGWQDVKIYFCGAAPEATTSAAGTYSAKVVSGGHYCARVVAGPPSYVGNPVVNKRPLHPTAVSYEEQVAGYNCYEVISSVCGSPTFAQELTSPYTWDFATDNELNFTYSYTYPIAPSLSGSLSKQIANTVNLAWSAQAGSGGIKNILVYNNGVQVATLAGSARSGSFTLGCDTPFSFSVKTEDDNGLTSSASNAYSAQTGACPPAPVKAPSGGSSSGGGGSSGSGSSGSAPKSSSKTGPAPTPGVNSAQTNDTTPPDAPSNFTATFDSTALAVDLSWAAPSDSSGISSYSLQRSTDQSNWTTVDDQINTTSYTDTGLNFNTHYYYRLTATDNAGNTSDYATADVETGQFSSNTSSGSGTTITSSDKLAVVDIPTGAVPTNSDCAVSPVSDTVPSAGKLVPVIGPYQLVCEDSSGNVTTSFSSPVSWTINTKTASKKYHKFQIESLADDGSTSAVSSTYNSKSNSISFSQSDNDAIVVLAATKTSPISATVISAIFLILLGIGLFIYIILRGQKKGDYNDYIRRKYYDI